MLSISFNLPYWDYIGNDKIKMKLKGLIQLLIPFATSIALLIVMYVLALVIGLGGILLCGIFSFEGGMDFFEDIGKFLSINPFDFDEGGTILFWFIDVILIIIAEFIFTADADE